MRLAIIGSNDLGTLIAHHATIDKNWEIAGFFDNKKAPGTPIHKYGEVLGTVDTIPDFYKKGLFDSLMIGVGYQQFLFRKEVFERFKGLIPFANLIHSSSYVDPSVSSGEGIFLLPGCVLDMNVVVEDNVLMNTGCRIAHDSRVGKHSFLGPGVTIAGKVVVGECCFLGVGSTLIDNVEIIPRTFIGGGAVVLKSIVEAGTYVGVPAKRIKANIYF